jgi:hypothetical protein
MTRRFLVEATILGEPVLHGLHDPWHVVGAAGEPGFLNSWVSVAGFPVAFRKDELGNVHIRGTAQTGSYSTAVFNLPLGYRPAVNLSWLANANPTSAVPIVQVIAATGAVTPAQKIGVATAVALQYMFTTEP